MDRDDPEERIAELERQQPEAPPERRRPGKGMLLVILVCAAVPLYSFGSGAYNFYGYRAGTPTTATVSSCHHNRTGRRGNMFNFVEPRDCTGTWSIGGVSQTGVIVGGREGFLTGSTVDVRVLDGKAYTAKGTAWRFVAGLGACAIIAALLLWAMWVRRARARWVSRHPPG
jgi:hypothetical protein